MSYESVGESMRKRRVSLGDTTEKQQREKKQRLASHEHTKEYLDKTIEDEANDGVAERLLSRLRVGRGKWRIGVMSVGTPYWFWALASLGEVRWLDVQEKESLKEETGASDWIGKAIEPRKVQTKNRGLKRRRFMKTEIEDWSRREQVDLIFFDKGLSPGPSHPVWSMNGVRMVFWIGGRKNCGPSQSEDGWRCGVMKLSHDELGGVSDIDSWIHVAERTSGRFVGSGNQMAELPLFVDCWANYLEKGLEHTTFRGVVDPTILGKACSFEQLRDQKERPLVERKVRWKMDVNRDHHLPSVFGSTGHVTRRIAARELAVVLDFPAELHKRGSEQELRKWVGEIRVPFKSRVQVVRSIIGWMENIEEEGRVLEKASAEEVENDANPRQDDSRSSECMTEHGELFTALDNEGGGSLNSEERREDRNLKATKSDDAVIPTFLWDD